jgi:GAF domain-containing protein
MDESTRRRYFLRFKAPLLCRHDLPVRAQNRHHGGAIVMASDLRELSVSPSGPGEHEVAETFARLAQELYSTQGLDETVEAVVRFALQALDCSYAGLALQTRRQAPEISAVSDPLVADIYQAQINDENGPLFDALRDAKMVHVRDVCADNRWPAWTERVAGLGVLSVLDVPLTIGPSNSRTVGVLGLYSLVPDGFDAADDALAHILAQHASVAIAAAREEANFAQAVEVRKLVGQATGILMERFDIDADHAFAALRRYSQSTNTKLRDLAQQLVDTRQLPRDSPNSE